MAHQCEVCKTAEAKYKCPTCRSPYCSLVCYKKHKETPCEPEPVPDKHQEMLQSTPASAAIDVDEEDAEKLTEEQLSVLKTSESVRKMLANPSITMALKQIECSQDMMKTLEKALLDPTFATFMYQALDEVIPPK
ncbi:Predicted MYND Zn-finger protein/hormone receptor interactor [Plasmopara halstedii]|uniref:Predicted MYND Zn-finger protein/hormone receptor interactor n=1 Tax=Plasmopara halstedii TaxID=4781 RepID=A0A0P1ABP4_PLAHL|nr:Predicted MYND Zn-finger protein/hormone receptor interactor [Plasmopara halstedii]CEG37721.1 Predicted MYND Zn-finger protein/hormone receptor interactor [Plasmopara halstedii]|eukprot:XP_024574090.1 Predicted MYND Zn-finger protein/hormone receptor interactor [Plasmopara halstedii]